MDIPSISINSKTTNGTLSDHIKENIKNSSLFLLVISDNALTGCVNNDDILRQEILHACEKRCNIVTVSNSDEINLPDASPNEIKQILS